MEKLSSKERFIRALECKEVDRVPVFELMIDPKFINKLYPNMSYYDFIEKIDHDAVGPNITFDALGIEYWIDFNKKIYIDRWGVKRRITTELIPFPIEGPIKTRKDLLEYHPPDPAQDPLLDKIPELVNRFKNKKATFILGRDVWTGSYMLRGMENFLVDLVLNPDMVQEIIKIQLEYYKEVHRLALNLGIDVIVLADDYAFKSGTLMSPKHFQKYIYPALTEIVSDIKDHGGYVIKHTDGNIWGIIDMLIDTGIDALGPLEPGANMDLACVKEKYGDKIAVVGNVDCDLLARGDKEEIKKEVLNLIKRVSSTGGHILSSANTISSSTKPDNFMEMLNICKDYGVYPIN